MAETEASYAKGKGKNLRLRLNDDLLFRLDRFSIQEGLITNAGTCKRATSARSALIRFLNEWETKRGLRALRRDEPS